MAATPEARGNAEHECSGKAERSMQQPKRYYITKSGEESTVRSVRVEQTTMSASDDSRRSQAIETPEATEKLDERRSVKDLVQGAIHKRHFFS